MDTMTDVMNVISDVNSRYAEDIVCRRENDCKHQVFRFNCMVGYGRYSCAIDPNWKNCVIKKEGDTCNNYESKEV